MEQIALRHADLGGVTTASTRFTVARRAEDESVGLPLAAGRKRPRSPPVGFLGASLGRVINPTISGRLCAAPGPLDFDSSTAVLDWNLRGEAFKLPSVFSKETGFVRRKLSDKELLAAMDVPASVVKHAPPERQAAWSAEISVPFKARFELIRLLGGTSREQPGALDNGHGGDYGKSRHLKGGGWEESRKELRLGEEIASGGSDKAPSFLPDVSAPAHLVAAKSDDAEIPVHVWNGRCRRGCPVMEANAQKGLDGSEARLITAWSRMLDGMRIWMLRHWRRRIASSFWAWWRTYRETRRGASLPVCQASIDAGLTALAHSVDASWWEWDRGSAPFFWRYPVEWIVLTRDGLPPRFVGDPPPLHQNPEATSGSRRSRPRTTEG